MEEKRYDNFNLLTLRQITGFGIGILQRLRRQLLLTSTAPWLYQKVGYEPINRQDYTWTFLRKDIYI